MPSDVEIAEETKFNPYMSIGHGGDDLDAILGTPQKSKTSDALDDLLGGGGGAAADSNLSLDDILGGALSTSSEAPSDAPPPLSAAPPPAVAPPPAAAPPAVAPSVWADTPAELEEVDEWGNPISKPAAKADVLSYS